MREAEAREADASAAWARGFPVNELVNRGAIRKATSAGDKVTELLTFFGVASVGAWKNRYELTAVAYRHSPSFKSDKSALAAWLRLVEIETESQSLEDYDKPAFMKALKGVRQLTRAEVPQALDDARQLCNEAGVALVWVKPLPKARVSGAAWWLFTPQAGDCTERSSQVGRPSLVQLFHEAAHIYLHSKKNVFVDWGNGDADAEGGRGKRLGSAISGISICLGSVSLIPQIVAR